MINDFSDVKPTSEDERDAFDAVKTMESLRLLWFVRCESRPEVLIGDFRSRVSTYASSYVLRGRCAQPHPNERVLLGMSSPSYCQGR
jgi:hypothetical protein